MTVVAYSFQRRFAEPIIAGTKCQTIRAHRKRHARSGEALQLYTGMRTKHCRKLIDVDPICTSVTPVRLAFDRSRVLWNYDIEIDGTAIGRQRWAQSEFARDDGFANIDDMADFWFEQHGRGAKEIDFKGVLIRWKREPTLP